MALILTRKVGQKVVITTPEGREITIDVRKAERMRVSLAIIADPEVKINRDEAR